ncbi:pheA operon leader peptide PheL [Erwiniaceae bacterium BAC15a-03b]|uniref:PheA operon leader peptide PheL n=1 Tax=Winslowiella arboricola TaxID=2978220 RepID=A0A9J6PK91_9GAMM|nr:pheA operon leader peptide PheL [Winslowiella arboricola]MCU5773111.1 pheA operon leader peptide PheL [Winslowiella arboricola]MCU5777794.1 pheA operon leader peptide PheL [Winslowiella arboricola]
MKPQLFFFAFFFTFP